MQAGTKLQARAKGIVDALQSAPVGKTLTYEQLRVQVGGSYDTLTAIVTTLEVIGKVRRMKVGTHRGRPKEAFEWIG